MCGCYGHPVSWSPPSLAGCWSGRQRSDPCVPTPDRPRSCSPPGTSPTARSPATPPRPSWSRRGPARSSRSATTHIPVGTAAQFRDCYGPTWGRFQARTRPAVGQPRVPDRGRAPVLRLLRRRRRRPGKGYYALRPGRWHIVVLNSNCAEVGGCGPTSPQGTGCGPTSRRTPARARPRLLASAAASAPASTASTTRSGRSGSCCTRPAPTWSSTATTTTTSGSPRRTRGAGRTRPTASASSWSGPAVRRCGRDWRPRPNSQRFADDPRRPQADPARGLVRLVVRADRRQHVHGSRGRAPPTAAAGLDDGRRSRSPRTPTSTRPIRARR